MSDNDLLELAWIDVIAAAEDHVFCAVDDRDVAVLVDDPDVAGVEPAVAKGLGCCFGAFVVALHHVWAANDDLASVTARDVVVILIDALDLDAKDRLADGAGF